MSSERKTLQWGFLATGDIARKFFSDLLVDPSTRDVHDVKHVIKAVGSSTSVEKARAFIDELADPKTAESITAYGRYEDVVADKDVEIVYIATPASHHYTNTLLALNAGKHVCVEKPFTINARQAAHCASLARSKKLFLLEALWTRFFPLTEEITRLLHYDRVLGPIKRVTSDLSKRFADPEHSLHSMALGGGSLLHMGIYPITWAMLALYNHPDNAGEKPIVQGSILKTPSGVDQSAVVALTFPKLGATAVLTSSIAVYTIRGSTVVIQGEKGDLIIPWSSYKPESYILRIKGQEPISREIAIPGHGLFWEADACARAIRDGLIETSIHPHADSVAVMEIMDQVRAQAGIVYPDGLEDVNE